MRTQYYTAVSLDGFIADEHHSLDWLFQFDGEEESSYSDFIARVGAIAMGSSTYEWLLRNHLFLDPEKPKPWPYSQPVWVFSTRALSSLPGGDIRSVRGPVAPVHGDMCRAAGGDRNIWIVGGGDLAAQFHRAGLLDDIIVTVAPVILTRGARLFTEKIVSPPLLRGPVVAHRNGLTEIHLTVPKPDGSGPR